MSVSVSNLARSGALYRYWYRVAACELGVIAQQFSWPLDRLIDVIAITSPRCAVRRNQRVAVHYLMYGRLPPAVIASTRRALQVYEESGIIRGPKTSQFAAALRGDTSVCVVDSWIARAIGEAPERADRKSVRLRAYRLMLRASRRLGWTVRDTQAAVWAGYIEQVAGRRVRCYDSSDAVLKES